MQFQRSRVRWGLWASLGLATLILSCAGASERPATEPEASQSSGARIWASNCVRCHNLRPPNSYADADWKTVVMHMRLRASLTGEETRAVIEFLQRGF